MADRTLGPQTGWAVGETITVYERDIRNVQTGSAITTASVDSDSTVTFTGLDGDKKFIATDGTTAVRFGTLTDPSEGSGTGLPAGGSEGQVLAKASAADGDAEWITGGDAPVDADATTNGLIRLAGDLTGTAASPQIASGAVGSTEIATNAVGSDELADNAVDTAAIANGAVTAAKVAADVATQAELDAHVNDTSAAHAGSAISFSPTGTIAGTDVQTAVAEVATDAASALSTHASDETAVHGIPDTALVPLVNVFNVTWPTRPDATIVFWIGGDASANDPSADMDVGDVWYPHSE